MTSPSSTSEGLYRASYSDPFIHFTMLTDKARMQAYKSVIDPKIFTDKTVLDVGCGSGILSLWAADQGRARFVVGVESADIAITAKEIIKLNKKDDKIEIIHGYVEGDEFEYKLNEIFFERPGVFDGGCGGEACGNGTEEAEESKSGTVEGTGDGIEEKSKNKIKFDIIISEWMGYSLFYENMLPSVLHARDKFLKKGGLLLPDQANLYCCGIDHSPVESSKLYWENIFGEYNMAPIIPIIQSKIKTCYFNELSMVTPGKCVLSLNLYKVKTEELKEIKLSFTLGKYLDDSCHGRSVKRRGIDEVGGLGVYFDVRFYSYENKYNLVKLSKLESLSEKNVPIVDQKILSTGPCSRTTHWKQSVIRLNEPIKVKGLRYIGVRMNIKLSKLNCRELAVELAAKGYYDSKLKFK